MSKKSYLMGSPTNLHTTRHVLGEVLACMRALQWQYWTAHWQVYGDPSYGDHLMFGKFYASMTNEIDTLAEKSVGYFGPSSVDPYEQIVKASEHMARFKAIDCLHRRGLAGEEDLQIVLRTAYEVIHQAGTMTLGLDDHLMSVANAHETNCYLLQQRIRDPKGQPGIEREPLNFELVGEIGKTAAAKIDQKGSGDWVVYFESDEPLTLHRWHHRTKAKAVTEAVAQAKKTKGFVVVMKGGVEEVEVSPSGKVTKKSSIRLGFNKYNAPELVSQLLSVLKKEGLKDVENQIRMKKIPQLVEKAWSDRDASDRLAATWFGRTSTDSGAGSAEGHFFDNPERREVREFHDSGAVSNEPAAAAQSVENMEEYTEEAKAPSGDVTSPADAAQAAKAAPPTPAEIRELPGDAAVSTLNRYIIKTEEPVTGVPESRDDLPKHPDEGAKVGRAWRVMKEEN
jgi:DNA-binding ferritin-like protein